MGRSTGEQRTQDPEYGGSELPGLQAKKAKKNPVVVWFQKLYLLSQRDCRYGGRGDECGSGDKFGAQVSSGEFDSVGVRSSLNNKLEKRQS